MLGVRRLSNVASKRQITRVQRAHIEPYGRIGSEERSQGVLQIP